MSIYIISEIGINHNGDIELAKRMILESKKCGVNAVKFHKQDLNIVYTSQQLAELRDSPWGKTQKDQKEALEFNEREYRDIDEYCKKIEIDWFASAWDLNSLEFLKNI